MLSSDFGGQQDTRELTHGHTHRSPARTNSKVGCAVIGSNAYFRVLQRESGVSREAASARRHGPEHNTGESTTSGTCKCSSVPECQIVAIPGTMWFLRCASVKQMCVRGTVYRILFDGACPPDRKNPKNRENWSFTKFLTVRVTGSGGLAPIPRRPPSTFNRHVSFFLL